MCVCPLAYEAKKNFYPQIPINISQECFDVFELDRATFLRFISVDKTWIHYYTPDAKQQSRQWVEAGRSASKKEKTVPSAGK